jgi:hypothetical protein
MMEISTKLPASFGRRCHALSVAAYAVRQRAIGPGGDFDSWRLSRLMREADTDVQVNAAEGKYNAWLQTHASWARPPIGCEGAPG